MQGFAILSSALLAAALLGIFPTIRAWWRAPFSRPGPAIILITTIIVTQMGSSAGINLSDIGSGYDGRRVLRAIILGSLLVLSIGGLLNNTIRWRLAGQGVHWMLFYALFATLSAIWSLNPLASFYKGFEVLSVVFITITLAGQLRTTSDARWLLDLSCLILLYLLMTLLAGLALFPQEALAPHSTGWIGLRGLVPIMNPSSQGAFAGLIAVSMLISLVTKEQLSKRDKIGALIIFGLAIFILLMGRARTLLFAGAFSMICVLLYSRRFLLAGIISVVGAIAVALSSETVLTYIYRDQNAEQFQSLTGRIHVWESVIESGREAPLLGKGFWATQKLQYGTGSVDNTFLEAFIGLGLIGLILLLIPVFIAVITLWRTRPRSKAFTSKDTLWLQVMAFFVILLIRGLASPTFTSLHTLLMYYLISHICLASLVRIQKEPPAHSTELSAQPEPSPQQNPYAPLRPRRLQISRRANLK